MAVHQSLRAFCLRQLVVVYGLLGSFVDANFIKCCLVCIFIDFAILWSCMKWTSLCFGSCGIKITWHKNIPAWKSFFLIREIATLQCVSEMHTACYDKAWKQRNQVKWKNAVAIISLKFCLSPFCVSCFIVAWIELCICVSTVCVDYFGAKVCESILVTAINCCHV